MDGHSSDDVVKHNEHLPPRAHAVKDIILSFDSFIPHCEEKFFLKQGNHYVTSNPDGMLGSSICTYPPAFAFYSAVDESLDSHRQRLVDKAKAIALEAQLLDPKGPKCEWTEFLRDCLFESFENRDLTSSKPQESRNRFSTVKIARQLSFNERLATYYKIPPSLKDEPEWTFGFKMAATDDDRIPQPLSKRGVFNSQGFEDIGLHAYYHWPPDEGLCFPWAVVQVDDDFTHCKSQALFDVTFALSILRQLYKRCGRSIEETPPVIFFTCSRPIVSVWIAWLYADEYQGAVLDWACIWETRLDLAWGVLALQKIVENAILWAAGSLRPDISALIGQLNESSDDEQDDAWSEASFHSAKTTISIENSYEKTSARDIPTPPAEYSSLLSHLRPPRSTDVIHFPLQHTVLSKRQRLRVKLPSSTARFVTYGKEDNATGPSSDTTSADTSEDTEDEIADKNGCQEIIKSGSRDLMKLDRAESPSLPTRQKNTTGDTVSRGKRRRNTILKIIDGLKAAWLIEITWRALDSWLWAPGSMDQLDLTVERINDFIRAVDVPGLFEISANQVFEGYRSEDINMALCCMLANDVHGLRLVLADALRCFEPTTIIDILQEEIKKLPAKERSQIETQAKEFLQTAPEG